MSTNSMETKRTSQNQIIKQPILSEADKDPYLQTASVVKTVSKPQLPSSSNYSTEQCCTDLCSSCCECFGLCCNGCLNFKEWIICCWIVPCDCTGCDCSACMW